MKDRLRNILRHYYLDGEELFRRYFLDFGISRSLQMMSRVLAGEGKIHPLTGKPPTRMGIWKAMWGWAATHPEEAYKIFNDGILANGERVTWEEWGEILLNYARGGVQLGDEAYARLAKIFGKSAEIHEQPHSK